LFYLKIHVLEKAGISPDQTSYFSNNLLFCCGIVLHSSYVINKPAGDEYIYVSNLCF
jgi:hypothetical protein